MVGGILVSGSVCRSPHPGGSSVAAPPPARKAWRSGDARETLAAVNGWTRSHNRQILIAVFAAAGAYLTIKGTINLLD